MFFCFGVPLTVLFATVLPVAAGVGGCWWHISTRDIPLMSLYVSFQIILPIMLPWMIP